MAYTPPTAISTTVGANVIVTASETVTGLPNLVGGVPQNIFASQAFAKGVAASQCDTVGIWSGTIAGAGTQVVYLSTTTPTLTDFVGISGVIFARVKFMYLHLATTTLASSITWGAGTNPFNGPLGKSGTTGDYIPIFTILNGGTFFWYDITATGYAVTVATNDRINIVNNDAVVTATVTLVVGGGAT